MDHYIEQYFRTINAGIWPYVASAIAVYAIYMLASFSSPKSRGAEARDGSEEPTVSILIPSFNEEEGLPSLVDSVARQTYGPVELVIADDGSTDDSFAVLSSLVPLSRSEVLPESRVALKGEVNEVWRGETGHVQLTVVRKNNAKSRADALNAAFSYATGDLCFSTDADSILDPHTVERLVASVTAEELGAGGSLMALNGCEYRDGAIFDFRLPSKWVERFQAVEYMRAFWVGRRAWRALQIQPNVSGASNMWRAADLDAIGGWNPDTHGEDQDVAMRMMARRGPRKERANDAGSSPWRVEYDDRATIWTEVPGSWKVLARQRMRWSRGAVDACWLNRRLAFNRSTGRFGSVTFPLFMLFELAAPFAELLGLLSFAAGWYSGVMDRSLALTYIAVLYTLSVGMTWVGVARFVRSEPRARHWRTVAGALVVAALEPLIYRPAHLWPRLVGSYQYLAGTGSWGEMVRQQREGSTLRAQLAASASALNVRRLPFNALDEDLALSGDMELEAPRVWSRS